MKNPHLGHWRVKKQSGDKFLMKNTKTGEERMAKKDIEGIKRGDYLQPVGKDKDKFVQKYGWCPGEDPDFVKKYLKRRGLSHKFENGRR